jgi:hypothetical protein
MINLSLIVSKYAWAIVLVGIISWITYMALKKPSKDNPEKLSRLGLAIEKAKPIFENFQKNVADSYAPKQDKVIDAEVVGEKKKDKVAGITDIKQEDIIKPIDF